MITIALVTILGNVYATKEFPRDTSRSAMLKWVRTIERELGCRLERYIQVAASNGVVIRMPLK